MVSCSLGTLPSGSSIICWTSPKMRPISLSPAMAMDCISSALNIGIPSRVFSAKLPLATTTSFALTVCLRMPNLLGSHRPAWS